MRFRVEMFPQDGVAAVCPSSALADQAEPQLCLTQPPTYEKDIAWARSRPQNCSPYSDITYNSYIDKDVLPSGRIAASQHALKSLGRPPKSPQELIEPGARMRCGKGQTQQETAGYASHGGYIANGAGEAFPPHRVGRMLVAKKVRPFQEPVTGKNLVESTLKFEERRIVADS